MRIENGVSNASRAHEVSRNTTQAAQAKGQTTIVGNDNRADVHADNVINDEMLESAVKQANKNLDQYNKVIERTVHEKTHTIMYVLRDTETDEVIREFPPKKIQDMIAKMWEMAGILVDERR